MSWRWLCQGRWTYRGADKFLARPGRKQANIFVTMAWISFGTLPSPKKNLMTALVSILLKSRSSLICFRDYFLPGRAKDLSASRVTWLATSPSLVKETGQIPENLSLGRRLGIWIIPKSSVSIFLCMTIGKFQVLRKWLTVVAQKMRVRMGHIKLAKYNYITIIWKGYLFV